MIDHDRLFKELLTTFFAEFVELFLPEVGTNLDPGSLEFLDKEVFTDVTLGERHEADLVVRARVRGAETFFLIHVEHQAAPQAEFGRRMFRYFARLFEKHELLVYPVVIFSYDTPQRAEPDRFQVAFRERVVLDFHYHVIQLNRFSWRDYVHQPNPVASALMAKMEIAPADRPHVKLECLRLLATLRLDAARMQLISGFVDTYLRLSSAEQQRFEAELGTVASQAREGIMQITTSWMEQGLEQGLEQGRQREAMLVLRQLARRVGAVPPELAGRVRSLSVTELEEFGDALLDFSEIADVESWLRQRSHGRVE